MILNTTYQPTQYAQQSNMPYGSLINLPSITPPLYVKDRNGWPTFSDETSLTISETSLTRNITKISLKHH
jgi:hypothetical protein